MHLHGIHHFTAITADGPANAAFYGGVLGLRMVKKSVNFDDPGAYHLYYGDAIGSPGTAMTFFEYPGAGRGRAGAGMVDRLDWSVPSTQALVWWEQHLVGQAITEREGDALLVWDPEGLLLRFVPDANAAAVPHAGAPHVPGEFALRRMVGVRARSRDPERSAGVLESIGFRRDGEVWRTGDGIRSAQYMLVEADGGPSITGVGTTHHVAWASLDEDHARWLERTRRADLHATPIIDRDYFRSIYFREPSGVLFELATDGPGFTIDEPFDALGSTLRLPSQHEPLRPLLEQRLATITDPWAPYR